MSFDFSPNINLSNVQASHKTTDGGGGNTGYFQRRSSDEESQALFKKEDTFDSFSLSAQTEEQAEDKESFIDSIIKFFEKIIQKIKTVLKIK